MLRFLRRAVVMLIALGVVGFVGLYVAARLVKAPPHLGVRDGQLAPCPDSPNCVSTQSTDALHAIEPIPYSIGTATAKARLLEVLEAQPRAEVVANEADYVHTVFRSPTMGYPDDIEFFFDEAAGLIHFRSAARLGYGDMGVNRRRMEQLSAQLAPLVQQPS